MQRAIQETFFKKNCLMFKKHSFNIYNHHFADWYYDLNSGSQGAKGLNFQWKTKEKWKG